MTPGTEKRALKTNENRFTPKESGTKKLTAQTAHNAPNPPSALTKKDFKKFPLVLNITRTIIKSITPIK